MFSHLALFLLFSARTATPHPAAASTPQPLALCSAVPQSQIELALGQHLAAAPPEYSRFASTCDYSTTETAVHIAVQHLTSPLNLAAEAPALKSAFPGSVIAEVSGLGTSAIALSIPDSGIQIHILRGDREYLLVSVMGAGDAQHSFEAAAKIAQALLRRQ